MNLKKIVVKSQLFLDTFEALFKLNIPLNVLHEVGGNNYHQEDKNLLLDCGYEIMKRKGRFQELKVHPFVKVPISSSKVNSLDHLVRQLSKEFEKLRTYGRECYTESLVEDYLPKVYMPSQLTSKSQIHRISVLMETYRENIEHISLR